MAPKYTVLKTTRTLYTDAMIANARKNIATYSWASEENEQTIEVADHYVSYGHEFLWNLITTQQLPRSYGVNQILGCPVCKREIDRYGNYPWIGDPKSQPWKIVCPNCKTIFPTNDFGAYYRSGINKNGIFDPALANRSLLVNEMYPDRDIYWGVDDGYGWIDTGYEEGTSTSSRYTFMAYHNHWTIWYGTILPALTALSKAFLYTGCPQYACAGTILLDRIADVYPEMDCSVFRWEDGFRNSHGMSGKGKIVGCIWETGFAQKFIRAYDALFPGMNHPDAIEFLHEKAKYYGMVNPKESVEAIQHNIENGIIMQIRPSIGRGQISGNVGMHQSVLALAASTMDHPHVSREWMEVVFHIKDQLWGHGDLIHTLVNEVDRDGHGDESSPAYNSIWLSQIKLVADSLVRQRQLAPIDLDQYPKFKKMFHMLLPLVLLGKYTPSIGDTKKAGDPGIIGDIDVYVSGFEKTGDPLLAQFAYLLNGNKLEGLHGELFTDNGKVLTDIQRVIHDYGSFKLGSTNMTGYGFAALRDGDENGQRAFTLYYGRNTGHGHRDALNIGIYAYGLDLAPDHGYPCFADENFERYRWTANTISHNTVVVDRCPQANHVVGIPHHYQGEGTVKLIDVEAPRAYPQTKLYRRTSVMIPINERDSYFIDVFRVKGGEEHHFSFHGAEGEAKAEGLHLIKQTLGTFAGECIPFADASHNQESLSGFNYLYNVERDRNPPGCFSVDWNIIDTWKVNPSEQDVHLRLTMLSDVEEVALADGQPPQNKPGNPVCFRYAIARRSGVNLESQYGSVFEVYSGKRKAQSITSVPVMADGAVVDSPDVFAAKIVLANGRIDYFINALDSDVVYTVDSLLRFSGFCGFCSLVEEEPTYAYVCDGTLLEVDGTVLINSIQGHLSGHVTEFTRDMSSSNQICVCLNDEGIDVDITGAHVYVQNDGVRNAAYFIKKCSPGRDGQLILDIGDITTIRSWVEDEDLSQGYLYDLSVGQACRIPLSYEWTKNP